MFLPTRIVSRCQFCDVTDRHEIRNCCSGCAKQLPLNGHSCKLCALPISSAVSICGECISDPPPFSCCTVPLLYASPVDLLVNNLKHRSSIYSIPLMVDLLSKNIHENSVPLPDLLAPIPLHWSSYLKRGFNQAQIIAIELSNELELPCNNRLLKKLRRTRRQQDLKRSERRKNMRSAFVVQADVKEKRIALVDDVLTTGATLRSAASTLLKNGAAEVQVWCIARTPPPGEKDMAMY